MRPPRQILLVYKKSLYQIYFLERRGARTPTCYNEADMARLKAAHDAHAVALGLVREALHAANLSYRSIYRARQLDYAPFDFVISVGGDGTLIEASRRLTTQAVLGVNSDPARSAGHFAATRADGFASLLARVMAGDYQVRRLNRMRLAINGEALPFPAMNEVLVAHQCPAAMSRYELCVGETREVQRGSGLWVGTAAGSTGAIRSAGGRVMPPSSRRLQYLSREPFLPKQSCYTLDRGTTLPGETLSVRSMMREGMLYVDGPHLRYEFPHGATLTVDNHPYPLRLVLPPVASHA